MPFYQQTDPKELGTVLRQGLNDLRSARYKLAWANGAAQQMTDAEFATEFGFDPAEAAAAKAELNSGISKLLANDAGISSAQVYAAVVQMLNQFG